MRIYHIVLPEKWAEVRGDSYEHDSLSAEGFIHCSFEDQIDDVLSRYFGGITSVNILEIDPAKLTSKLVIEPSTNGERYPHIYGSINVDAVTNVEARKLT
jgi:uncharacterized protein (DUF952 family)